MSDHPHNTRFLSTLSLRRATRGRQPALSQSSAFLSTLSLRRATRETTSIKPIFGNFYPRSPCGERPLQESYLLPSQFISIHALLAESDTDGSICLDSKELFLSTLSLRRATSNRERGARELRISIHALLAESDVIA